MATAAVEAAPVASSASVLALLEEDEDELKLYALQQLDRTVDGFWFQISGSISAIEALYEDEGFRHRELAALVASKVFYHLGDLDDALTYALGAGALFDVGAPSEYAQTVLAHGVDTYVAHRAAADAAADAAAAAAAGGAPGPSAAAAAAPPLDPRLAAVVERLFDRCGADGRWEHAAALALEARRLDRLAAAVRGAPDPGGLLRYALAAAPRGAGGGVPDGFRDRLLRLAVELWREIAAAAGGGAAADPAPAVDCLVELGDAAGAAAELHAALAAGGAAGLAALQVAFALHEAQLQGFSMELVAELDRLAGAGAEAAAAAGGADGAEGGERMDEAEPAPGAYTPASRLAAFKRVVGGAAPIALERQFLARACASDLQLLRNIKAGVEPRNSVCHSATVLANALMHAGTTNDAFLRENLDWLAKATNWAKFGATAGLGVIHRGSLAGAAALVAPYLPAAPGGASASPYSEGGALFALGLIHAGAGAGARGPLLAALRGTAHEVVQHGACLGLGVALMGTADAEVCDELKAVLYTDSAVAGEAAGLALGLLAAGAPGGPPGSAAAEAAGERVAEMLAYAHDTAHEKIARGLAVGVALSQYGRGAAADGVVEAMCRDQDPVLRYGGVLAAGLAAAGAGAPAAVARLLRAAVTDVSDDVRRGAALSLGFALAGQPEAAARAVAGLAESYNAHARYGAALAVGLAGAGSGSPAAAALLEPLLSDAVDFVQQGALVALALVLGGAPEARARPLRERVERLHSAKGAEVMARMGAIMAAGLLDAGGRNAAVALRAPRGGGGGGLRAGAVLGLAVFAQHWYWYPLAYCASLALAPTMLMGVDAALRPPKGFAAECGCKPSVFAHPPPAAAGDRRAKDKLPTAVLSTTARARARAAEKKREAEAARGGGDPMDAETPKGAGVDAGAAGAAAAAGAGGGGGAPPAEAAADGKPGEGAAAAPAAEEPASFELPNPSRVVPGQRRFVSFPAGGRWAPVRPAPSGFLVLADSAPGEPVEYAFEEEKPPAAAAPAADAAPAPGGAAAAAAPAAEDDEPPPPEAFEYVPTN